MTISLPSHAEHRKLRWLATCRFGDEGYGAGRARIHFQNVGNIFAVFDFDRDLHVHQADDFKRHRHQDGVPTQLVLEFVR